MVLRPIKGMMVFFYDAKLRSSSYYLISKNNSFRPLPFCFKVRPKPNHHRHHQILHVPLIAPFCPVIIYIQFILIIISSSAKPHTPC